VRVIKSNNLIEIVSKSQLHNKSSSSYFTDTIHLGKGELYVSAINLNKEKGVIEKPIAPVIRYATPVYSKEGKQRGIIVANILVNELFELAKNEALEQKDNQKLFVVNQQGYYLNHPDQDKEWGFEYNKDETVKKDFPEKIVKQILSKENGLIEKGVKDIISYQTIFPDARSKSNPFVIVNQTPKSDILAPINQVKWVSILITIILAGGFVTLGVIILNQIVKTMSELAGVVSSFSSQVVSTVDEQESIASQQSSSVQETTATMEQLNASSQQSAQQAQIAVTKAQEAIKSVSKGNEAVEKTVEEMATVKFKVQQIAEQIQLLSDTSNQVINISDLVSDLANRTNMLALNAAVEAVRTGEHGKGFRVVATEIRKLADQSKQSGQKIHTLVEQINNAIQSTVHVTDDGKESVETSVKIAQNTAMVFTEVAEAMNQIVESSQEIALNYQQQATATQQVTETMSHIQNGAAETARGIGNMKTGTEQLNQAAVKLHDVI
ncbi:MAG: methyl-accepting chemotaxis protein, partial [Microcystaceae cyanobacterium]